MPPNSIERHIRWLVDSDYAFVRPRAGSVGAESGVGHVTPQKLTIEEANQVLTFLDRQSAAASAGSSSGAPTKLGDSSASDRSLTHHPSPPRTPPEGQALAKAYPHHVRYMASACSTPPSKALFYLEQAADAGSRLAGAEAGQMYVLGIGCTRNVAKGLRLLDAAAQLGHPGAMLAVGRCLREGTGVPVDVASGVVWMDRAASVRYAPATHELAELYETGVKANGRTSPPPAAAADDEEADGDAQEDAGDVVVQRDLVEAYRLYKVGAELDHAPSQLNLAKLFMLGSQLRLNEAPSETESKARYWLEKAAAGGSLEAKGLLTRATHDDPEKDLPKRPTPPPSA